MAPQHELRRWALRLYGFSREYVRLLAHPVEVGRALRHPTVAKAFPRYRRHTQPTLLAGTASLVGGAVVIRRVAPRLLTPALGAVAAAVAGDRWLTSAARGRRKNWPPGAPGITPLSFVEPDHFADRARRFGPVFTSNFLGEPMACVMGNARAIELLRDHEKAIRHSSFNYFRYIPGGSFRDKQGIQHKQDRAVLAGALNPRLVDAIAPRLRAAFDALLADMAAASQAADGASPAEWLADRMFPLWQEVFFGLELDRPALDELRAHYRGARLTQAGGGDGPVPAAEAALRAIEAVVRSRLQPSLEAGTAPVCLATEIERRRPGVLDDQHLLRVLIYLSNTTTRDMTGLLRWLFKHLADNPGWLSALRAEAAGGADPGAGSVADHVVSETLRMEQSEYLHLVVKEAIPLEGYTLPEGWRLRVCVHENHRDPAVFEDPDSYRPERWTGRTYGRSEFAPFGMDDHSCLGETLTRTTARAFALALAAYDVRVVDDGPREFHSGYHFGPNERFRVALTRRA